MTVRRYTQIRGLAQAAEIRTATYRGAERLVVPVVAMVAGAVLKPLGSAGPEYVPADVLAMAPESWNGRCCLEDHPLDDEGGPVSANSPEILEALAFGEVFHARYEGGRLKMEAYLDPAAAARAGGKARRVMARLQAFADGEASPDEPMVEVSVGAYVLLEERAGVSPSGEAYDFVWRGAMPDHLAIGLGGARGACSAETGCGAPRAAKEEPMPRATLRAAILGQARRPTFSGTETSAWSAPSWADYVRYLHEGREGPASVGKASAALKREVAAHSLLGDPDANNLAGLTMLPVVNPSTGKLNERALRAVIGGRGAQADVSEGARDSARDMARRLLNSEFGAELELARELRTRDGAALEAASMSDDEKTATKRSAAESENVQTWLSDALEAAETGYDYIWVESFDSEAGTVVYCVRMSDDPENGGTYRRSYALDGETVTLADDRVEVRRKVTYEEVPAPAEPRGATAMLPKMLVRALEALGFHAGAEPSDVELREAMERALRKAVAGYAGIAEIYPSTNTVIYASHPEDATEWWRRTYALDDAGAVTLQEDAERVEVHQEWVPVQARAAGPAKQTKPGSQVELEFESAAERGNSATPCGCESGNGRSALSRSEEGEPMTRVQEIVGRLIANARCPYDDKDRPHLESLSEEKLKALGAAYPAGPPKDSSGEGDAAVAPAPTTAAAPKVAAEETAEKPAEEPKVEKVTAVAAAAADPDTVAVPKGEWEDVKVAAAAYKAARAEQKAALVKRILAAQSAFTEDDLNGMGIDHLEKHARSLKLDELPRPDFSGRALSTANERPEGDATPPDPYAAGIAAARAARGFPPATAGKEAN